MRKVWPLGQGVLALAAALCFCMAPLPGCAQESGDAAHAEDDHGADHAAEGEHDAEGEHGSEVPLEWQQDLALWSLVVFILFVFVLGKFAWGPLASALDIRESRIRNSIAEAEAARLKAEQMLAEHAAKLAGVQEEVKAILAEARRDADQARQNILGDTQREVAAMRQRTLDEIGRARDQALKELFDAMAGQVVNATEHVLGRSLDDGDQNRLIDEALSQFSQGGNGRS